MKNENKGLGAAANASEAEDVEAGAPTPFLYTSYCRLETHCGALASLSEQRDAALMAM